MCFLSLKKINEVVIFFITLFKPGMLLLVTFLYLIGINMRYDNKYKKPLKRNNSPNSHVGTFVILILVISYKM